MGLFDEVKEPVFLKLDSDAVRQLEVLKSLELKLNDEGKKIIQRDIKCLEYGIVGEQQVTFELKNSHMPMYVLQDIYLEHDGLSAQIDFLVVTKKLCFIIECKNLYGNIEINSAGDFTRTMSFGGRYIKEGIYSPITQNERHFKLIKAIKRANINNKLMKIAFDYSFGSFYDTIVVLANPKTVINNKYAKKEIKDKVIKSDQLVNYISNANKESKELKSTEKEMKEFALKLLNMHIPVKKDYTKKYNEYIVREDREEIIIKNEPIADTETLVDRLKKYRLETSRNEGVKPYFVFSDKQLNDLLEKMPATQDELLNVSGFGTVKVEKYGSEIISIINSKA